MFANREGRFRAEVIEKGVAETGENKLTTVTLKFLLEEEYIENEWRSIIDNPGETHPEITGYFYIEKKDRSINEFQVKSLKEAFGWDGREAFWFEDNVLPKCQVTLAYETWNDKAKLKVQFVNHYNSEGGGGKVESADQTERQRIVARLGSKLRALSGGTPAAAPATAQATSPPQAPPETPETATDAPESSQQEAWQLFTEMAKAKGCAQDVLEREWWRAIKLCAGGISDTALVTPAQWYDVQTKGLAKFDNSGFDDLPF